MLATAPLVYLLPLRASGTLGHEVVRKSVR